MRAGATEYLSKPVDRQQLMAALRKRAEPTAPASRDAVISPVADIVGNSAGMQMLFRQMQRVASRDVTVLIHGESGTGKELVARALHDASPRRRGPFVAINCAAIAQGLQESELFGHEKGAFTGAAQRHAGRFEQADGGTLFLDEIGEIAPSLQASLLRAIQERRFHRVGGSQEVRVDVRILAATHRDLMREVAGGRFREDLYYRLAVFELDVPPLRERGDDVLHIAERLLANLCQRHGLPTARVSAEAARMLIAHDWPGNVRELQNALERAVVLASGSVVTPEDLPPRLRRRPPMHANGQNGHGFHGEGKTAEAMEKSMLIDALAQHAGNVSEVCRVLGIPRTTMYRKLKRHGIPT
jgi:DNA-binding NtrC family response regulator